MARTEEAAEARIADLGQERPEDERTRSAEEVAAGELARAEPRLEVTGASVG